MKINFTQPDEQSATLSIEATSAAEVQRLWRGSQALINESAYAWNERVADDPTPQATEVTSPEIQGAVPLPAQKTSAPKSHARSHQKKSASAAK